MPEFRPYKASTATIGSPPRRSCASVFDQFPCETRTPAIGRRIADRSATCALRISAASSLRIFRVARLVAERQSSNSPKMNGLSSGRIIADSPVEQPSNLPAALSLIQAAEDTIHPDCTPCMCFAKCRPETRTQIPENADRFRHRTRLQWRSIEHLPRALCRLSVERLARASGESTR